ncbi:MAG: hypothetical protein KatS3mg050_4825 [Litorilinea sp.]|nr:MAG: hypothetical protein KatS3mg050_4825 [Litorilinea sp.]
MTRLPQILLTTALFLAGCVPVQPITVRAQAGSGETETLWVDVSLGPGMVDWFNRTARSDDIARIDHLNMLDLLDQITVGQTLVVFKSIQEAREILPSISHKVDIIGYNLENGPANLPGEKRDPVGSVRQMRELADRYGARLAVGPDHDFALNYGVAMATYADLVVLQVQRVQTDPETVGEFVLPLSAAMRQANPEVAISMQVAATGDMAAVAALIRSVAPHLDGVSILTDHKSAEVVSALMKELRMSREAPPAPPQLPTAVSPVPPAPSPGPATLSFSATDSTRPSPSPANRSQAAASPPDSVGKRPPLLVYLGVLVSILLLGAITFTGLIYMAPSIRRYLEPKKKP